jgi:hypothetical protein
MSVDFDSGGPVRNKKYHYDWYGITAALRAHPGKWGIVTEEGASKKPDAVAAAALRMRQGGIPGGSKGEFDVTVRGTTIYARYVKGVDLSDE